MQKILSLGLMLLAGGTFRAAQHGTDHSDVAKTYVGTVAKAPGGAMIGAVIDGERFLVYLCSNDEAFNASHAHWFRGKVGEQGNLEAEAGGAKLVAKLAADKIDGTVTGSDNQTFKFTAAVGKAGGVYRAEAIIEKDHYIAGWVRNDDGATVGAALKKGKQTALKQQPSAKANVAPEGLVGQGDKSKKLTGTPVDELGIPLPGQILQVTLTNIDLKKRQFTVKTGDGKSLTLSAENLFSVDATGRESRVDANNPTPFIFGVTVKLTRECKTKTVTDKNGKKTTTKDCKFKLTATI